MPALLPTLFTVSVLASTALICAAPTADKSIVRKVQNVNANAVRSAMAEKKRRRAKRAVIVEDMGDDQNDDQEEINRELAELSNDQLELLAEVVQNELDKYTPDNMIQEYEVVRIPPEMLVPEIMEQFNDEDDEEEEYYPRDRRSMPLVPEDDEFDDVPQLVVVPEEILEEAFIDNQRDEMELRERIAEIAQLLNERAYRGL